MHGERERHSILVLRHMRIDPTKRVLI